VAENIVICSQCQKEFPLDPKVKEFFQARNFPVPDICNDCHAKIMGEVAEAKKTTESGDAPLVVYPKCPRCREDITPNTINEITYEYPDPIAYNVIVIFHTPCKQVLPAILIQKVKKIVAPGEQYRH
jgi:hypothetical protein